MTRRPLPDFDKAPELVGKDRGYKGLKPENMPWELFLAAYDGERVDAQILMALDREMSLDEMYDLIELRFVADSWSHAYYLNNPAEQT